MQGKGTTMSSPVGEGVEVRPFRIDVPEEDLVNLRQRIAATRWPSKELVEDRSQGVQLATMQELARYWATDYDWRKGEARLNALPQFVTQIDGVDIHFIHVTSPHKNALPLIMTHGWPGSVIELLETVGPLTDPTRHGGRAEDAFHLVLPSLPGYGYSSEPTVVGWHTGRVALAAWMLDHDTDSYYKITHAFLDGQPSGNLTRDHILDNVTLYWLTGTGASAARNYWEDQLAREAAASQPPPPVSVPA